MTKSVDIPLDKGRHMVEAKLGEPLTVVKAYTEAVRREIDWELVDRGLDFMTRQKTAGNALLPLYARFPGPLSISALAAVRRRSRIGQFGDSLMDGDAIVGTMLDDSRISILRETQSLSSPPTMAQTARARAHSAVTCQTWERLDPTAARWLT